MTRPLAFQFADVLTRVGKQADDSQALDVVRQRLFDIGGAVSAGRVLSGADAQALPGEGMLEEIVRQSAAARASEVDDIDTSCCVTAGAIVLPVVLALGAARQVGDHAVARAIVMGYEAAIRLGRAIDGANAVYSGVWPSLFVAPVAAAAAAASVMGAGPDSLGNAIALAATRISGAGWLPPHPSGRWLAFGSAVAEGVRCAGMAVGGLKGDPMFLESGLSRMIRIEPAFEHLSRAPSEFPAICFTDIKPFPTARQVLSAIEAARCAWEKAPGGASPERIRIAVPRQYRAMIDRPSPPPELALASVQLQVATALLLPDRLASPAREDVMDDPAVQSLLPRISVVEDAHFTALYPEHWSARVEIETAGRCFEATVIDAEGTPAHPLGWDGLGRKLERMNWNAEDLHTYRNAARLFGTNAASPQTAILHDWIGALARPRP